jgi:S1-C subfamily serine protease
MQAAKKLCTAVMGCGVLCGTVWAQDEGLDQALKVYAVHVSRVPKENWTGVGVYLGDGLVLTAGHVAGEFWRTVEVGIAGQELPTHVLKRGQFSDIDLALLSIEDDKLPVSLRLRRMPICSQFPFPGEPVVVATPEGTARSHIVPPAALPKNVAARYRTAISDVATTGNSGSGVFDAAKQCLLGIISGKITQTESSRLKPSPTPANRDIAKFFVPASTIAAFLPPPYAAELLHSDK